MYREERIKVGIDVCIIYFGVMYVASLLSQLFAVFLNQKEMQSVNTKYLNMYQIIRPILILVLLAISFYLYKRYRLRIHDTVFLISGILLIFSSLSSMAISINSVFVSMDQVKQAGAENHDLFARIFYQNVFSMIGNIINLFVGIWLIMLCEKRVLNQTKTVIG